MLVSSIGLEILQDLPHDTLAALAHKPEVTPWIQCSPSLRISVQELELDRQSASLRTFGSNWGGG